MESQYYFYCRNAITFFGLPCLNIHLTIIGKMSLYIKEPIKLDLASKIDPTNFLDVLSGK